MKASSVKYHDPEPETAYSDFFNIGVNLYNEAGCVTNIAYKGTGGYSRNLGLTWNSQYQLTAAYTNGTLAESYALEHRVRPRN